MPLYSFFTTIPARLGLLIPLLMVYTLAAIPWILVCCLRLEIHSPKKDLMTVATTTKKMQLPNHAAATFPVSCSPWLHF